MAVDDVPGIPDPPRLARWLSANDIASGDQLDIVLIAGGRSNLTYRLDLGGSRLVLRRPPLGHVLPTAHDMSREYRVLSALSGTDIPVPTPIASCTDPDVIGSPFYLMGYVDGRCCAPDRDGERLTPDQARQLSERLAEMLAAIHQVDVEAVGLTGFGRPEGYMARQLARWQRQWELSNTREMPGYDRLVERLAAGLPADSDHALVHGDFRLDNMLVTLGAHPAVAAVVDWEMSTLGDPLADLGLTLIYWADPDDDRWMDSRHRGRGHGPARLLQPGRARRPLRAADRPGPVRHRLLHGVRLLQAGGGPGGHPRPVPAAQDRGRGLRAGGAARCRC